MPVLRASLSFAFHVSPSMARAAAAAQARAQQLLTHDRVTVFPWVVSEFRRNPAAQPPPDRQHALQGLALGHISRMLRIGHEAA